MKKYFENTTKTKIVILGFFVLFIPIFLLNYELDYLYSSKARDVRIDLKEKLLNASSEIKTKLAPYNYLDSEFSKIHSLLLPDFQEEITDKIPEISYVQNLYSEELLKKLIEITKDKYSPILISLGTNNLENFHIYFSPKLEQQIESKEDRTKLKLDIINSTVIELIYEYKAFLRINPNVKNSEYYLKNQDYKSNSLCYKYLSRFACYSYNFKELFTDYFEKQVLINITRHSFSKKGIHGYYSLLIPQSSINPDSILDTVLNNDEPDVHIELVNSQEISNSINQIIETKNGFEYYLDFNTDFINHLKTYEKLKRIDKSSILLKKIRLFIDKPDYIIKLQRMSLLYYYLIPFFIIVYIIIALAFLRDKYSINIELTSKLTFILFIIMFVPIIGVGLLILISSQSFNNLIDYNVSKNLNNELKNIYCINQENQQRHISTIFELKRKIKNTKLPKELQSLKDINLTEKDIYSWFQTWNSELYLLSQENNCYSFKETSNYCNVKANSENEIFLKKFANNLGILSSSQKNEDDISSSILLTSFEKYIPLSVEEEVAGEESVSHKNLMSMIDTRSGTYFYAKDQANKQYLLLSTSWDFSFRYNYLTNLRIHKNNLWYKPSNKYSDIDIGVTIRDNETVGALREYPNIKNLKKDLSDVLKKSIEHRDSGVRKTKNSDGSRINQWIFEENDPFIIGSSAKSNYNTYMHLSISMIFPVIILYTIFVLFLLINFVSIFIKKPISIYNTALEAIKSKEYGIKINSFSKDEFDSITTAINEMSEAIKQKYLISRYVSNRLIQSVSDNNIQEAGKGKLEKVTILSSDIRNFTGISEMYSPSDIVEMLNTYFTQMQKAISDNGGIIDKYIGDAIQAVFYDEPDLENQVLRAIKAAISMEKALKDYNAERKKSGLFTIQNGIGIDTDIAITGTIGTAKGRKDFSVNGNVIARAANLEAKTKLTQSKILISKKSLAELELHNQNTSEYSELIYNEFDNESVEIIDVR